MLINLVGSNARKGQAYVIFTKLLTLPATRVYMQDSSKLPPIISIRSDNAMIELQETYVLGRVLGHGAFGIVNLAEHRASKQMFACKTIKKKIGSTSSYEQQEREVNIMKLLRHKNILQLYAVYECPKSIALILELCEGGEIVEVIRQQGVCTDTTIRDIITQLVDAVCKFIILLITAYLHRNRVIHRGRQI